MGYYFQGAGPLGKGQELVAKGARKITQQEAKQLLESSANEAVFCVVDNGFFEAAALAYSQQEFDEFTRPEDKRPKRWYAMEKAAAHALAGYTEPPVGELAQAFADRFEKAAAESKALDETAAKRKQG